MVPGLLGREPPRLKKTKYNFSLSWLRQWTDIWPDLAPGSSESKYVLRHFLMEPVFLIFCDASGYRVHADWLVYLADLDWLDLYDWGNASYAWLRCGLDDVVRLGRRSYVGLYPLLMYWAIEHVEWGYYFYRLHEELLPLPRQWCEPDHRVTSGIFSYEVYRYLLDLLRPEDVMLRPIEQYKGFHWAPQNSTWELRRQQIKFYYMKRSAYYLPRRVRHQFTDEFSIPTPPADMVSKASSRALARSAAAEARARRSRFTLCEVSYEEYLGWFEQFSDILLLLLLGFEEHFAAFYEDMKAKEVNQLFLVCNCLFELNLALLLPFVCAGSTVEGCLEGDAPSREINVGSREDFSMKFEAEDMSVDEGPGGASSFALGPSRARATPAKISQRLGRKVARTVAAAAQRKDHRTRT